MVCGHMNIVELLLLAIGVAMDAFAVSISNSMCYPNQKKKSFIVTALAFGFFQALMPTIGFFAGKFFGNFVMAIDHWIAFILLGIIGGKMIYDGIKEMRHPEDSCKTKAFSGKMLFVQAIATSIDAFAVGISLAMVKVDIIPAVTLIGIVTFLFCIVGGLLGNRMGKMLGQKAEIFGGLVLVGIGIKIFVEHMMH